jgi:peroxiredoxin
VARFRVFEMKASLPWLVALALLAVLACGRAHEQTAAFRPIGIGEPVPAYAITTLAGDSVRLGGTQPVTIVNVWATWCTSCKEEMSDLESLHRDFGSRGARVIAISVDGGDGTRVRRFMEAERLSFMVAHDPDQRVQLLYQVAGVPETFVVGRDGRLLWRHVGNLHPVVDSARASIARALATDTLVRSGAGGGH